VRHAALDLRSQEAERGEGYLYNELKKIDPPSAERIHPKDMFRIIRALEICRATGQPVSKLWQKRPPTYPVLIIGLTMHRDNLYRRIDSRVDEMIKQGLIEEVKDLMAKGYSLDLPSMSGIGYKQIGKFLQGKLDLTTAIQQIKNETHRFARHQYAWFHLKDDRIRWLNTGDDIQDEANGLAAGFLSSLNCTQVNYEVH